MSNQELFDEACQYIPGGVNSPVRAFQSVESAPVFVKSAKGSRVLDEENHEYNSSFIF